MLSMGTKRHLNHILDDKAVELFKACFPCENWAVVEQVKDFVGIDFRVDLYEEGFASQTIFVQLKGRGQQTRRGKEHTLAKKGGYISQSMDVTHLDFYGKVTTPVFLIVVDTTNGAAYWLFMQKYLKDALSKLDWRLAVDEYRKGWRKTEPTVSVRVPVSNQLSNIEEFRRAIERAHGYMARLAILRGIEDEERSLSELDPRFDVKMKIVDGTKHFEIRAKESAVFTLMSNMNAVKWGDFVSRGKPIDISPGELQVSGSPLWEYIIDQVAENRGRIYYHKPLQGFIDIIRLDENENEVGRLENVPCRYECSSEEITFTTEFPQNVILVTGQIDIKTRNARYEAGYDIRTWCTRDLLELPLIHLISRFLSGANEHNTYRLDFHCLGGRFAHGTGKFPVYSIFGELADLLIKAQEVARHFGLDPVTPAEFHRSELEEIAAIYDLIKGEVVSDRSTESIRLSVSLDDAKTFLRLLGEREPAQGSSFTGTSDWITQFMGHEIVVPRIYHKFTNMRIATPAEALEAAIRAQVEIVEVKLASTSDTVHTTEMLSE